MGVLLLENGSSLLLENGSKALLEDAGALPGAPTPPQTTTARIDNRRSYIVDNRATYRIDNRKRYEVDP